MPHLIPLTCVILAIGLVIEPSTSPLLILDVGENVNLPLVYIKPGAFVMGSPASDKDAFRYEKPAHEVRIAKAYYLGKHPVTRQQFSRFVDESGYKTKAEADEKGGWGYDTVRNTQEGPLPKYTWRNPGFECTKDHPVVNVAWQDAKAFCTWLSKKTGRKVELPTEAEWEYACRAGTTSRYFTGDEPESLKGFANVGDQSLKAKKLFGLDEFYRYRGIEFFRFDDGYVFTSPIGTFRHNPWGLGDMAGNVRQWCMDWFGEEYYGNAPRENPGGPETGEYRIVRGGSWFMNPRLCRSACRFPQPPGQGGLDIGIRIVIRVE